ncbi:hypothetical protein [Actinopolymorpha rutila]|uniref:Uncharacterized protein n=1 Tax=Actinopolymorpha rutila TaxID=446787 RepID=A0A852ZR77_9ACTN|nr:hypothetical protein [Actinopolymorpha rutila]NYH91076.1 hypothetical protein [Actinopolymorpha rutila]
MSAFLVTSSVVTTLLIPAKDFQPGGPANGRALAYLAHEHHGSAFGSAYDCRRSRSCGSRVRRRWPGC